MRLDEKPSRTTRGIRVEARDIGQLVRGGRQILSGVSFTARPGQLLAIIGASGAGKSTLIEALAGVRTPTSGQVRYDGRADLRGTPGFLPSVVGYLPQDDVIHRELPLATTLRYAARLRLPAGTPMADIVDRVNAVLGQLGLSGRAGVPVGSLSGGERKRASIAVELLTRPRVLFLDEPTSGLDPATANELMTILRTLADGGATVIVTTHNVDDVGLCDRVAVLDRGHLAFDGPPESAPGYFGVTSLTDIYLRLARQNDPSTWAVGLDPTPEEGSSASTGDTAAATDSTFAGTDTDTETTVAPVAGGSRRRGPLGQWWVLSVRNLDILRRNRLTLAILIGSPLIILAMFVMLFRAGAFDVADPSPSASVMILFWIAFGGFFFGLTYGLLQICTEVAVRRRERLAGVRGAPYVLSKFAVLLPLVAGVDLALLLVLRWLDRLPAVTTSEFGQLYVTLLLCSACALALGLLCSAGVSDVAQAALVLPMLCFPQVLFVGAILPVPVMAAGGRWLSYAMSNRWAFEALGHTVNLPGLWRTGPLGPPLLATYGDSFDRPVGQNWLILGGFTVVFLAATWGILAAKARSGNA